MRSPRASSTLVRHGAASTVRRHSVQAFLRWGLLRRAAVLAAVSLAMIASVATAGAQRVFLIGPSLNLVGGGNDSPGLGVGATGRSLAVNYGVFPSMTATMTGANSTMAARYSYGADWTGSNPAVRSNSHSASLSLARGLNARWSLSLSNGFALTSDTTTFNLFSGQQAQAAPPFLFQPIAVNQQARTNRATMVLSYSMTPRTSVSMDLSHNFRIYGGNNQFPGSLSSQQNAAAGFTFSRQSNRRDTWSAGYRTERFFFDVFDDSASHTLFVGYGNQLSPEWDFQLTVGASRIASLGAGGTAVGYNTSVALNRTFNQGAISLSYSQATGQSSGLGSNSNTRSADFAVARAFGDLSLSMNLSGFDARGTLNNPFDTRGLSASAGVGVSLTDTLSISGGASFQRYTQAMNFGFTQKRVFLSLSYSDPDLWRFNR